jgi:hypothetical protein
VGEGGAPPDVSQKKNGPLRDHFLCRASMIVSVVVMAMLDDNDPSVVMSPAMIAMFAKLGARAVTMMVAAVPDHHGFSAGDRRSRDSNRAKCRNDVSKLLHTVLLGYAMIKHRTRGNVPRESKENSEQAFRYDKDKCTQCGCANPDRASAIR